MLDYHMLKRISVTVVISAVLGVALAQVEATSSSYFLDIDPARYNGPPGQRIEVMLGDQPRHIALTAQDEICIQLKSAADKSVINAHLRVMRPQPHEAVAVPVAGPGVAPGTYRSTPWGMLVRIVPAGKATFDTTKPLAANGKPVCTL
jgi:hypothetical protein